MYVMHLGGLCGEVMHEREIQTRSLDEPAANVTYCEDCGPVGKHVDRFINSNITYTRTVAMTQDRKMLVSRRTNNIPDDMTGLFRRNVMTGSYITRCTLPVLGYQPRDYIVYRETIANMVGVSDPNSTKRCKLGRFNYVTREESYRQEWDMIFPWSVGGRTHVSSESELECMYSIETVNGESLI